MNEERENPPPQVETPDQLAAKRAEKEASVVKQRSQAELQEAMKMMQTAAMELFMLMNAGDSVGIDFFDPPPRIAIPNGPPPQPRHLGKLIVVKPAHEINARMIVREATPAEEAAAAAEGKAGRTEGGPEGSDSPLVTG